ncbi:ATP-dependent helicase [Neobacillus niacini]|uniref:ATP-dependent helicase n=1 Tax=Neobacillus niacini TaxID=86668 RepID=UPI0021CB538D|nr:ATP-dependent helicase [Neobacillus niacini]MCM3766969.1 ATP-dependent helicase [Neobacillus niacini]
MDFFERKKREIGVSLNEVQRQAVLHTHGPLLLLASPGSGKTTTTIMRIGYLIEEKGVRPSRIKAVTFSVAAAEEMRERFARFFPGQTGQSVDFSTIHSWANKISTDYLRRKGFPHRVIAEFEKKSILKAIFQKTHDEKITEDQLDELSTYITLIKNKLVPMEDWGKVSCEVPNAKQIVQEYEQYKKTATGKLLVDYDDMLTIANHALNKDPMLLGKYQQQFDYILTDESQDTSKVQHLIIEKLVRPHRNLYIVADDDQSIYGWRGADPQYLLDFQKVYPDGVILKMGQNYRSSKDIVKVANQFIKQNKYRYEKNMFTENPPHKPVVIKTLADYRDQAKYLVQALKQLKDYREAAVLFRNNSSAIIVINELDRAGIPFYIKDHDLRFFSHWVVKDILNFMRLSFNENKLSVFMDIYKRLNLYLSKEQVAVLNQGFRQDSVFDILLQLPNLKDYQVRRIRETKQIFQEMRGEVPLHALRTIRYGLGYEDTLLKMSEELGFNEDHLLGILSTLELIAEPIASIDQFAARLKHLESAMNAAKDNKGQNVVTLSTFHSSKGLEFKRVYMIDLIQGIIPSQDDVSQFDEGNPALLEEAVRLFYVGMTRAELHLELLAYRERFGSGVEASQFVGAVRRILSPTIQASENRSTTGVKQKVRPHSGPIIREVSEADKGWKPTMSSLALEIEKSLQQQNEHRGKNKPHDYRKK